MYGNGCAGSTASGVSTGKMRSANISSTYARSSGDRSSHATNRMPASSSAGAISLVKISYSRATSASTLAADRAELLAEVEAVGRGGAQTGGELLQQPRDPHLEELVEVVAQDGEELRPLEQRQLGVLGQGEHAGHEVEPRQLAVEEALGAAHALAEALRLLRRVHPFRPPRRRARLPPRPPADSTDDDRRSVRADGGGSLVVHLASGRRTEGNVIPAMSTDPRFAEPTPFARLVYAHAVSVAGDACLTVSLAGSLFFQSPTTAARGKVLLYLLLTMAPFAIVAPDPRALRSTAPEAGGACSWWPRRRAGRSSASSWRCTSATRRRRGCWCTPSRSAHWCSRRATRSRRARSCPRWSTATTSWSTRTRASRCSA